MTDTVYWGTTMFYSACYLSAGLAVVPTVWFVFHGHSAAASLGIWVTLASLVHAINSTVWRKDAINRTPTWCDISSQLILIYSTGSICSCLCIAKFLAFVLSPSARNISHDERRRINIRNYVFSLGFPTAMIPFHYLYSPNRFGIVRTMGCEAPYTLTWPAFFFFMIWSPIFGMIAVGYTGYVVFKLFQWKTRKNTPKNSTKLPVQRLAWLCITYVTVAVPLSIYYLVETIRHGSYSSFSVQKIRVKANEVDYEPYQLQPTFYDLLPLIGSGIYIVFFTFSIELRTMYKKYFWKLCNCFVIKSKFRSVDNFQEVTPRNLESHMQVRVAVDFDTEMAEFPEKNDLHSRELDSRASLRHLVIDDCVVSPSPLGTQSDDLRFSITSSDQTFCSSPHAMTALIPKGP